MKEAFEKFERLLDSTIRNLSQAFYDQYVEANAKFRAKAGLKVTIVRESLGECCDWCSDLAGTYSYENAPDDLYARHRDCNCVVSTKTEKGTWQDAWSKKEYNTFRENRIAREEEIFDSISEKARKPETEHKYSYGKDAITVDLKYIESQEYRMKYHGISGNAEIDDRIYECAKEILKERNGSMFESLYLIDGETGVYIYTIKETQKINTISYSREAEKIIKKASKEGRSIIAIHNHPEGFPPTADDAVSALKKGYSKGIVCGHNGKVYTYEPAKYNMKSEECDRIHNRIALQNVDGKTDVDQLWKKVLKSFGIRIDVR